MNAYLSQTLGLAMALAVIAQSAGAVTQLTGCTSITQPGSYVLPNNISGGSCIRIDTDNVTLDFNGHRLDGPGFPSGISIKDGRAGLQNIVIRNGTITRFATAIDLTDDLGVRVEDMRNNVYRFTLAGVACSALLGRMSSAVAGHGSTGSA